MTQPEDSKATIQRFVMKRQAAQASGNASQGLHFNIANQDILGGMDIFDIFLIYRKHFFSFSCYISSSPVKAFFKFESFEEQSF